MQRLKYERDNYSKNQLSERFNPRFKQINAKMERIDEICYIHSLEKRNTLEITHRLRELAALRMERKYR